jgi:hypothetical protein
VYRHQILPAAEVYQRENDRREYDTEQYLARNEHGVEPSGADGGSHSRSWDDTDQASDESSPEWLIISLMPSVSYDVRNLLMCAN